MPRERSKLTDKQERLLVQAQLMGLSARDIQQISNRLIAMQKESEQRQEIDQTCQGYTWRKIDRHNFPHGWEITHPGGYVITAYKGKKSKSNYYFYEQGFDIRVKKPGTRFKDREFKEAAVWFDHDWKKRMMPEQDKDLYALLKWCTKNQKEFSK